MSRFIFSMVLAGGWIFTAPAALALEDADFASDYLAIGADYMSLDSGRLADYGAGFNAGYGRFLSGGRALEARISTSVLETGKQTGIDFYRSTVGLAFLQSFGANARWFALAGVGAAVNDVKPDVNDGTSGYGEAGLGWRGAIWNAWGIRPRLDLRYVYDSFDSGQSDVQFNLIVEMVPRRQRTVEETVIVENVRKVEVPVIVETPVVESLECRFAATEGGR